MAKQVSLTLDNALFAQPAAPSLAITGGAAGSYSYVCVGIPSGANGHTQASTAGSTAVGPTTLDASHFIDVTPPNVAGMASYDVYRTVGGATQGKIGNTAPGVALRDNGLVGDTTTAPATNTTGIGLPHDVSGMFSNMALQAGGTFAGGDSVQVEGTIDCVTWMTVGSAITSVGSAPVQITGKYALMRARFVVDGTGAPSITLIGDHGG